MRQAVQWRLLLENPADGLKLPQQSRNEMRALTVEQARTLLRMALTTAYGPVLAVALTTGMRPSEHLGLKWQDINWERQTISVVRSIRRLNGRWWFSDTKRARSRRPIRLQSWIVALLRELQTQTSAISSCPEGVHLLFIFRGLARSPLVTRERRAVSQLMPIVSRNISRQSSSRLVCQS